MSDKRFTFYFVEFMGARDMVARHDITIAFTNNFLFLLHFIINFDFYCPYGRCKYMFGCGDCGYHKSSVGHTVCNIII